MLIANINVPRIFDENRSFDKIYFVAIGSSISLDAVVEAANTERGPASDADLKKRKSYKKTIDAARILFKYVPH